MIGRFIAACDESFSRDRERPRAAAERIGGRPSTTPVLRPHLVSPAQVRAVRYLWVHLAAAVASALRHAGTSPETAARLREPLPLDHSPVTCGAPPRLRLDLAVSRRGLRVAGLRGDDSEDRGQALREELFVEALPFRDRFRTESLSWPPPSALSCGVCSHLWSSPAVLDVLTHERFRKIYSARQRQVLRRSIPWTRLVEDASTYYKGSRIRIPEFIARNRRSLVLLPVDPRGDRRPVQGWTCGEAEWQEAVERAAAGGYAVQERVRPPVEVFPVWREGLAFEPVGLITSALVQGHRVLGLRARIVLSPGCAGDTRPLVVPVFEIRRSRARRRRGRGRRRQK